MLRKSVPVVSQVFAKIGDVEKRRRRVVTKRLKEKLDNELIYLWGIVNKLECERVRILREFAQKKVCDIGEN